MTVHLSRLPWPFSPPDKLLFILPAPVPNHPVTTYSWILQNVCPSFYNPLEQTIVIFLPVCLSPWLESLDLLWLPLGREYDQGIMGRKLKGNLKMVGAVEGKMGAPRARFC